MALNGNETLLVGGVLSTGVPSGQQFTTTTQAIANLGSGGGGSGTVTSVTFTGDGTILSSTPSSAVTTSGTLAAVVKPQSANLILAGPASGGSVSPTFRSLVAADIPGGAGQILAGATPALTSTPTLGVNGSVNGSIGLANGGGSGTTTTLKATQATTAGIVFNLPATNGSNTNVLQTDGSGNTSWVAAGGGGGGITALTGDVTASGSGSVAATVAAIAGVAVGTPTGTGNVVFSASPTFTGTLTGAIANWSGAQTITSTSANALVVGINGATTPAFQVDASTALSVTGWAIKSAISGGGATLTVISSATNESGTIGVKGAGNLTIFCGGNGNLNFQNGSGINRYQITGQSHNFTTPASGANPTAPRFSFTGGADTALSASTEAPNIYLNMGQTRQNATGALTLQRDMRITGTTHSFVAASVLTDCAAIAIDGFGQAGTNATITNAHGLLIQAQAAAGTVTNMYGITVAQPTGGGTTNFALNVVGNTRTTGQIGIYNNVTTTGLGVPAIYGSGRSTAQSAAVSSVAAYTVGAADGSFYISANVLVTASTTHTFTVTVAYTDEGNNSRTLTLTFSQATGTLLTAITNVQGVGAYEGVPLHIRCKASTSITVATVGTFTSVTYNVEALISQLM